MIRLLAPTRVEAADEADATFIIEVDRPVFHTLGIAVQVALEDAPVPDGLRDAADEIWRFFHEAEETR